MYNNQIVVLPITEIITSNDFDYRAKYEGKSEEITPANLENNLKIKLEETAKTFIKNLRSKVCLAVIHLKDNEFYF